MTSGSNPINNEYIDGEVLALLKRMPGLTTESIYSATRKSEVRSQKSEVDYSRLSAFTNVLTIMRSAIL